MLTSDKRAQIAAAAEAIEAAATMVRDLLEDEPRGHPPTYQHETLAGIAQALSDQRKFLLLAWS